MSLQWGSGWRWVCGSAAAPRGPPVRGGRGPRSERVTSVGGPVNYSVRIRHGWPCRRCGEDVQDDTYMVVDALARPDLVQQVIKGKVPSVTCPSCGASKARFFPLLVYRGEARGQLVYFYPPRTPPEQDEADKKLYVEALLDRLGPVSAEEAENSGVLSVPFDAARGVLAPTARGASAAGGPRMCRVKPPALGTTA
ncbi:CpXC domain-containing protein [Streptomyces sp. NPDC059680]|uniref:CpXC domain-containing protein n=1 Tax=Streptomyces sp. NPDC059680 TaxID=3346904 RepID=UPI00369CB92C